MRAAVLLLGAALAACGTGNSGEGIAEPGLVISFEDAAAPEVYLYEGEVVADGADGAAGLWASVPRLAQPERGLVARPDGAAVVVALFRGPDDAPARLSAEATRRLGLAAGERSAAVITALRQQARVEDGQTDF